MFTQEYVRFTADDCELHFEHLRKHRRERKPHKLVMPVLGIMFQKSTRIPQIALVDQKASPAATPNAILTFPSIRIRRVTDEHSPRGLVLGFLNTVFAQNMETKVESIEPLGFYKGYSADGPNGRPMKVTQLPQVVRFKGETRKLSPVETATGVHGAWQWHELDFAANLLAEQANELPEHHLAAESLILVLHLKDQVT